MAKRLEGVRRATQEERNVDAPYASELRLRRDTLRAEVQLEREPETDPAPPPVFHASVTSGRAWSHHDRELAARKLWLVNALAPGPVQIPRGHSSPPSEPGGEAAGIARIRRVFLNAEALGDALFVLWTRADADSPPWSGPIVRVYRWASDVLEQLEQAVLAGSNRDAEITASFRLIASYSSLLVRGLIAPALAAAISRAANAGDAGEAERLADVQAKMDSLDRSVGEGGWR